MLLYCVPPPLVYTGLMHLPTKSQKTTIYLEDEDYVRLEVIKKHLSTTKDAPAIRFAIRNIRVPKKR